MKKLFLTTLLATSTLLASDAITIDSMFKKSEGLRSTTSIDILSSSGTRKFSTYPNLVSYDDGIFIDETKKVVFNQSLLYGYTSNLDLLLNFSVFYQNVNYIGQNSTYSNSDTKFDTIWIGGKYTFDTFLYEFKQSVFFQTALIQNSEYQNKTEQFNFKSYNLRYSLQHFSDPIISTISFGTTQNLKRKIDNIEVDFPNSYTIGLDVSLILNPKVSLNFNFEENYQTNLKENNTKVNSSTILSTMGFGLTYNLNENNALTFNSSIGTSSNAPDSRLSFSLWHKF